MRTSRGACTLPQRAQTPHPLREAEPRPPAVEDADLRAVLQQKPDVRSLQRFCKLRVLQDLHKFRQLFVREAYRLFAQNLCDSADVFMPEKLFGALFSSFTDGLEQLHAVYHHAAPPAAALRHGRAPPAPTRRQPSAALCNLPLLPRSFETSDSPASSVFLHIDAALHAAAFLRPSATRTPSPPRGS